MDLQSFIITFRETLEALLIVGIITTYLTRVGLQKWNKWVWLGVAGALLTSYGIALLFQVVLTGYGAMASSIYLRFGIMVVSCALLTHMVLFIVKQGINYKASVEAKVAHIVTTGSILNMLVHSYLVVLREGVETVFFFAAISGGNIEEALTSWGALLGVIAASVLAYFVFNGSKRVPLQKFFQVTGVFLMFIAAGLLVQAVAITQDLKLVGSLYETAGGEIAEVYNIVHLMPEHPIDEEQYERDTGEETLLSGQIGIFFKAFLGYSHNPSLEEVLTYWGYFLTLGILMARERKKASLPTAAS